MKICDFIESELNTFRQECNFTQEERDFFELRARGITLEEIQEKLFMSKYKADSLSSKVKKKICKVIKTM